MAITDSPSSGLIGSKDALIDSEEGVTMGIKMSNSEILVEDSFSSHPDGVASISR